MNEWSSWQVERKLEQAEKALTRNGFAVTVCRSRAEAAERIEAEAEGARTVGVGGSVTMNELGFPERLIEKGYECLRGRGPGLTPEQCLENMRRQLTSDLFLCGANAVTMDGKLVNVDQHGNRVAAMTFGPRKVVVAAGSNKLVADVEAGLRRVRLWVAPPNNLRLGKKTPCAVTGECSDCRSPERSCRIVHVLERRPITTDIRIVLIAEALGL